jgi:hypothetical protein
LGTPELEVVEDGCCVEVEAVPFWVSRKYPPVATMTITRRIAAVAIAEMALRW